MAKPQTRRTLADEARMGRFSRMHGVHHRIWAPPESRVWIEYSNEVLRELRLGSANSDAGGLLFGTRRGSNLRVLAARTVTGDLPDTKDPRLAGLEPVGIFAA